MSTIDFHCNSSTPVLWSFNGSPKFPNNVIKLYNNSIRIQRALGLNVGIYQCGGSTQNGYKFIAEGQLTHSC